MKKVFFLMLTLLVLSAASVNAQVTIGANTDPHSGAVLDLQSTMQGLKLPTVSLGSLTTFGLPLSGTSTAANAKGMYVYNTNTTTGEGTYLWDGSQWLLVKSTVGAKPVTGITITAAGGAASILYNATLQLTATVAPSDASNQEVIWGIAEGFGNASVDATGLVSGIKAGHVMISATASNGKTAYYKLSVTNSGTVGTLTVGSVTYRTYDFSGVTWMVDQLKGDTLSFGTNIKTQYNRGGTADPSVSPMPAIGARGYYYNSAAAATACPSGWRLPTSKEFNNLRDYMLSDLVSSAEFFMWHGASANCPGAWNGSGWGGWNTELTIQLSDGRGAISGAGVMAPAVMMTPALYTAIRCVKR
jgi:hypothetical protein